MTPSPDREKAVALHREGWAEIEKKDYHKATLLWREAIAADPGFYPAYRDLAYYYHLLQEYAAAAEIATGHIAVDPKEAEPHLFLALALLHLGRPEPAASEYRTALALLPGDQAATRKLWQDYWRDHRKLIRSRARFARLEAFFARHPALVGLSRRLVFEAENLVLLVYAPLVRSRFVPKGCLDRRKRFSIVRYLRHRWRDLDPADRRMMYARVAEAVLHSETVGPTPGASVIDIGTGTNSLPFYWAKLGMKVTVTDPDDFVLRLRPLAERMGLGPAIGRGDLRFEVADGAHLPFPDNSFDFWTSVSVVEHIPDQGDSAVMREAARVLKPGGIAVVTTEGGTNPHERWIPVGGYFGKQYNQALSEKAGTEGVAEDLAEFEKKGASGSFALLREYDYPRLMERLVEPSGLEVIEIGFLDQRFVTNYREIVESARTSWWGVLMREINPLLCYWSYRRVENPESYKPRLGSTAYVILKKPA